MESIRHRVGINAPIEDVYEAIATRDGAAQWWSRDVRGESKVGSQLEFRFGSAERVVVVEIVELTAPDRVVWRCVKGPEEWIDATFTFDLRANGEETVVLFTHAGWREAVEFMHHCTTKWGYFLMSMKHGLEGGTATPFPDDEHISSWD